MDRKLREGKRIEVNGGEWKRGRGEKVCPAVMLTLRNSCVVESRKQSWRVTSSLHAAAAGKRKCGEGRGGVCRCALNIIILAISNTSIEHFARTAQLWDFFLFHFYFVCDLEMPPLLYIKKVT